MTQKPGFFISFVRVAADFLQGLFRKRPQIAILKRGRATRVVFFYPGEEGTYVDQVYVTLFENGITHLRTRDEEVTTHLQNCEILWSNDSLLAAAEGASASGSEPSAQSKVRLIRPFPKMAPSGDLTPTPETPEK